MRCRNKSGDALRGMVVNSSTLKAGCCNLSRGREAISNSEITSEHEPHGCGLGRLRISMSEVAGRDAQMLLKTFSLLCAMIGHKGECILHRYVC
jgi:hypothetical protein